MAEVTLEVSGRDGTGKSAVRKLRQQGKVPGVVYGGHRDPVAIIVDRKAITDLIQKSEHGVRSVFLLKMAGTDQQRHAMIKDIQIDPINRKMMHVDFIRVVMDEVVRVSVPVVITGSPIGVREGGLLDFQVRELHVECLPNAIPDKVEIDISELGIHHYFRISDLPLPEGVKVLDDPNRVVVGVTHQRAEVVPEVPVEGVEEVAPAEPEVISRGKKVEEVEEEA
ncbi:MAG: 50S ribosomal protein L25 [Acidobacteria bacterium]|nr:MAG: 50S ribosomal protein L25 [Acidobacteriota bacterium]